MDTTDLRAFEDRVRASVPAFRVAFKDEVGWMRVLGGLVRPFHRDFMTRFTTTLGTTVYFPSRAIYESSPKGSITVLAHEWVHLLDHAAHPFWFSLSYLFPQILAPFGLLAYVAAARLDSWPLACLVAGAVTGGLAAVYVGSPLAYLLYILWGALGVGLAFAFTGWVKGLLLLLALAPLAPFPAPWRTFWEKRGYTVNLAVAAWTLGMVPKVYADGIASYFTGPSYYYMAWGKAGIDAWVAETSQQALGDKLPDLVPYREVQGFLGQQGRLRG
jgi:hypothetical protein